MAGASVTIEFDDREVRVALQRLESVTGNLRPVFAEIGEYLAKSHDDRFARQVTPEGEPWTLLSIDYVIRKEKNWDKILTLDGNLRGTLHPAVSADELQFGTNRIYGATHQFGDPDRNIVARPFLGVSAEDETEILDILQRHIETALR
jgi:phage virion morphogenesis protein